MGEPGFQTLTMLRRHTDTASLGSAHHHRHGWFTTQHITKLGGLIDQHVHGQGNKIKNLNFHHRAHAGNGRADAGAGEAHFSDRRIADPVVAKALPQALGDTENAARLAHILTHHKNALITGHFACHGFVKGLHIGNFPAAAGTRFRQMEVARGIMPFGGATLRFPTLLGWGDAMKWLLTGAEFTAAEALRIGLIQEVVADGEQFAAAGAVAARIAAQAPLAVQATRRNAALAVEHGPAEARAALMGEARRLMHTQDAAEGLASFVERREARFKGL